MKRVLISLILISIITATACSKKEVSSTIDSRNEIVENTDAPLGTDNRTELEDVYILALDSFMPLDEGLNGDMKYIAIDTQTLKDATQSDKKAILKYFEKYNVEIMDESFETLKSKGMVKELNILEGLLLRLEKVEKVSNTEYVIEGSKFRSGKGSVWVKSLIKKENNKWILYSSTMTGVS